LAIISHVPLLANQLGPDFLQDRLGPQCMMWLHDQVFSIREAATGALEKLTQQFGSDWARDHLVPEVLRTLEHENYLYRVTALNAIAALAAHVRRDVLDGKLLPAVTRTAQVRWNMRQRYAAGADNLVDFMYITVNSMTSEWKRACLVIMTDMIGCQNLLCRRTRCRM